MKVSKRTVIALLAISFVAVMLAGCFRGRTRQQTRTEERVEDRMDRRR